MKLGKKLSTQFWVVCASSVIMGVVTMPERDTLTVFVENIKDSKGKIKLVIFKDEEGFPDNVHEGFMVLEENAKAGSIKAQFKNLPEGEYAVAVFQDWNEDNKLNTNYFGIPSEPFACSNNPVQKIRKPHFSDAKFKFHIRQHSIKIHLHQE